MFQSTFMGLNTALRGVLAHQNALDVTGHNISNLSTEGYTRQRAQMTTSPAWSNSSAVSATTPGQAVVVHAHDGAADDRQETPRR